MIEPTHIVTVGILIPFLKFLITDGEDSESESLYLGLDGWSYRIASFIIYIIAIIIVASAWGLASFIGAAILSSNGPLYDQGLPELNLAAKTIIATTSAIGISEKGMNVVGHFESLRQGLRDEDGAESERKTIDIPEEKICGSLGLRNSYENEVNKE